MELNNRLRTKIRKVLVRTAGLVAERARSLAASQNVPRVPESIEVSQVTEKANYLEIEVFVNPSKMIGSDGRNINGAAWAYEYGSGLFGKEQKKYRIDPKNATVLKFPGGRSFFLERRGQQLIPIGQQGNVYLPYVEHPGVGDRPFFGPALRKTADEFYEMMADAVVNEIGIEIERAWDARK